MKKRFFFYFAFMMFHIFGMENKIIDPTDALYDAVYNNNPALVENSLHTGANPNGFPDENYGWFTPLGLSIHNYCYLHDDEIEFYQDYIKITKLLLEHGANPNTISFDYVKLFPDTFSDKRKEDIVTSTWDYISNVLKDITKNYCVTGLLYPITSLLYQYGAVQDLNKIIKPLFKICRSALSTTESFLTEDKIKIGLLLLSHFEKQKTTLNEKSKNKLKAISTILNIKNVFKTIQAAQINGCCKKKGFCQKSDEEIKQDLDEKENEYLKACINWNKKNVFKTIQAAQINGCYSHKIHTRSQEEIENPLHYNGRDYVSFKKFKES